MAQLTEIPRTYPVSDLRTQLGAIEAEARETQQPIVLTRNGASPLVVMYSEAFNEHIRHERAVRKLREAEIEEKCRSESLSHEEVKDRLGKLVETA